MLSSQNFDSSISVSDLNIAVVEVQLDLVILEPVYLCEEGGYIGAVGESDLVDLLVFEVIED